MRVRVSRNAVRARTLRRAPSREARERQIETAPEEMHGAHFAGESRTKFLQHAVDARQNSPEPVRMVGIVARVRDVALEPDGVRHFLRHRPDFHLNAQRIQGLHDLAIESGDASRVHLDVYRPAPAGDDVELVLDKVEVQFEISARAWYRGR